MSQIRRIIGIDVVRSVAICGAMLSHVIVITGFNMPSARADDLFSVVLQTSAPIFIVLFGTMLELAYKQKFVPGTRRDVSARLLTRAIQCFVLYALSIVALMIAWPGYSLPFGIATILFLGVTPFTDILKFYAVVLAFAPLLLLARTRFGLLPLALGSILLHAAWPLLAGLPSPAELGMPKEIDRAVHFFFELGSRELGGPSVIRGLTLVVAGMVLGHVLTAGGRTAEALRPRSLQIAAVGAVGLLAAVAGLGPDGAAGLTDMSLRQAGHPFYYLFNLPVAVAATALSVAPTVAAAQPVQDRLHRLSFFGRTSLFTFSFGNMLLYLAPRPLAEQHPFAATAVLIGLIASMSWAFDRLMAGTTPLAAVVRRVQGGFAPPARRIVAALI